MKKVLIVSYYFPPYTGIEGHRPYSWYRYFRELGLDPIVVTRQWVEGSIREWRDCMTDTGSEVQIEQTEWGEVHRLPYYASQGLKKWIDVPIFGTIWYWWQKLKGNLHIETDSYFNCLEYCRKICKNEKPDFILVTSAPLNILRLGHELSAEFNIPYFADFKDSHDNRLLKIGYKPGFAEWLENHIFEHYMKKWLRNAFALGVVCWPMEELVNKIGKPTHLVMNGFEEEQFEKLTYQQDQYFRITVLGTIYPHQEIDFMVEGFRKFLEKENASDDIRLQFIGLGLQSPVAAKLREALPERNLLITYRLPRLEALGYLTTTTALYYPAWLGYRGIYSGKIFEYLITRLPILIAPGDRDVIDDLIGKTEAGYVAHSVEDMSRVLSEWYALWKEGKPIPYRSNDRIFEYSNWNQARILAEAFHNYQPQKV